MKRNLSSFFNYENYEEKNGNQKEGYNEQWYILANGDSWTVVNKRGLA